MAILADVMTDEVLYLLPGDSVQHAAAEMRALNVGVIPVCDNDRRLLGVVTDRDIVLRVVADGRDPVEVALEEIATLDPIAGQRDWTLEQAGDIMSRYQIRRLPVVEAGVLVGIVSLGDLAIAREQTAGAALEEISRPAMPRMGEIQTGDYTT